MRSLTRVRPAILGFAALTAPAFAQTPPMQAQFQVSQDTLSYQSTYGVAMDDAGRFVVTWLNYNGVDHTDDCTARLFDPSGAAEGNQFGISASATDQFDGPVAKDASGRFIVVWFENETVHRAGDSSRMARRSERRSPSRTPRPTTFSSRRTRPATSSSPGAGSCRGPSSTSSPGSTTARARLWGASSRSTPIRRCSSRPAAWPARRRTGSSSSPGSASAPADRESGPGRSTPAAIPRPVSFTSIREPSPPCCRYPRSRINGAGEFVVAWEGVTAPPYQGIFARQFDSKGQPLGPQFPVANGGTNDRRDPQIASDRSGNFLVTWTAKNGDGDADAIGARAYDRFGTPASSSSSSTRPRRAVSTARGSRSTTPAVSSSPGALPTDPTTASSRGEAASTPRHRSGR